MRRSQTSTPPRPPDPWGDLRRWQEAYSKRDMETAEKMELSIRRALDIGDRRNAMEALVALDHDRRIIDQDRREKEMRHQLLHRRARHRLPSYGAEKAESERVAALRRTHQEMARTAAAAGGRYGVSFDVAEIGNTNEPLKDFATKIHNALGPGAIEEIKSGLRERIGRGVSPAGFVASRRFQVVVGDTTAARGLGASLAETYGSEKAEYLISQFEAAVKQETQRTEFLRWVATGERPEGTNRLIDKGETDLQEQLEGIEQEAQEAEVRFQTQAAADIEAAEK